MAADAKLSDVLAHIDAQRDSFLRRLIDYVRHPSISAHNIGIKEVAELLIGMLDGLGFETRLVPTKGHPMVVGRWLKAAGAPASATPSCSLVIPTTATSTTSSSSTAR